MTPMARNTMRKELHFSAFSGMSTKKIITTILLLSLPRGVNAVSISGFISAAVAFGAYLTPLIQQFSNPLAYAGASKVGTREVKSFLNDSNVKIYSAIVAAITVFYLVQKMYSSQTNRMRLQLESARLSYNAEQRRLNREAANRMANRQLQMFNRMVQSQGAIVKQAVQEAVTLTRPMLMQLENGRDPIVPVPRLMLNKNKQN